MNTCKQGFTLAEVATALAIVGVVIAMTMPLMVKNIQKQQAGSILGKAAEQIELGCQNMIQSGNMNKMTVSYTDVLQGITEEDLGISSNSTSVLSSFADIVPAYWGLNSTQISNTDVKTVTTYSGGTNSADDSNVQAGTKYSFSKLKAGIAIAGSVPSTLGYKLDEETGLLVYIDTNGWENYPNAAGKDVFAVKLLNNGTLYTSNNATDSEAVKYAAQVVKEGFKVKY